MEILIPAWVDGVLQPVEKLAAHQRGLRHLAVSVFVMDQSRILLQQRALGKYHTPGLWANTCCTHPAWREDPADCAQRRLKEELGIGGLTLRHRGQLEYRADVGGGMIEHEVVDVFVAKAAADLPRTLNPDEVQVARWVEIDVLRREIATEPESFTPWLRIYLAKHAEAIFGTNGLPSQDRDEK